MVTATGNLRQLRLKAPASPEDLARLRIGDVVYLDGVIYTGREGVYRRSVEEGVPLPSDLPAVSNVNFHCSPAASREPDGSYRIGAVTATASFRFAKWMERWFAISGARVIVGKGGMSGEEYRQLFRPAGAVYLTTVGYGTGALLGRGVRRVLSVHWLEELGIAQAMWVLEVEKFGPLLVDGDLEGNSLFDRENAKLAERLRTVYEGLREPALKRYGETTDRGDEVV